MTLIAVVGMVREARIIAGEGVVTVIGGGDSAGLEARLEAVLARFSSPVSRSDTGEVARRESAVTEGASATSAAPSVAGPDGPSPAPPFFEQGSKRPALLLSFGVCGALSPELAAGDLIIASSVISGGQTWPTDPAWTQRLAATSPDARIAPITAGDTMIASAAAKRALHEQTAAAAVDMESHIVARLAERYALPFAVVRAVSDAADHALPPAALAGLKPDGTADIGAVLWSLARRPGQLPALLRTAREAEAGFRTLESTAKSLRPLWENEGPVA